MLYFIHSSQKPYKAGVISPILPGLRKFKSLSYTHKLGSGGAEIQTTPSYSLNPSSLHNTDLEARPLGRKLLSTVEKEREKEKTKIQP